MSGDNKKSPRETRRSSENYQGENVEGDAILQMDVSNDEMFSEYQQRVDRRTATQARETDDIGAIGDISGVAASVSKEVNRLLETGLAKTIGKIVQKQAALIFSQVADNVSGDSYHIFFRRSGVTPATVARPMGDINNDWRPVRRQTSRVALRARSKSKVGGEILEVFNPDDSESNVDRWLHKIDQLGAIHGWSDYERSCYMQAKLAGSAKKWFHRLDSYEKTLAEWKAAMRKAFRRQQEFADSMEELVGRKKLSSESMAQYYHAKLELCERCGIKGEQAVSLLIRGLPENMRVNAHAISTSDPEELYTTLLAKMEGTRGVTTTTATVRTVVSHKRPRMEAPRREAESRLIRCYNCQEYGTHLSRDCPKSRGDRCRMCGQGGHIATQCPNRKTGPTT